MTCQRTSDGAQAIDRSRAAATDFAAECLQRTGEALAWLRARHADGTLPLLRLPEKRDDIATILGYAALLRDGASDVVFLGTGGSSLGGQTLAQLAGYARARRRRACASRRASISWTISIPTATARCSQRLPLATSRFVAVSKSGGTGETLMQTIAALDAREGRRARSARACSSASPSRPRPASATACAICFGAHRRPHAGSRSRRRRALFGADQCRAAAGRGLGLDIGAIRAGRRRRARAGARQASRRPRCRPRSAPRSPSRSPPARPSR